MLRRIFEDFGGFAFDEPGHCCEFRITELLPYLAQHTKTSIMLPAPVLL